MGSTAPPVKVNDNVPSKDLPLSAPSLDISDRIPSDDANHRSHLRLLQTLLHNLQSTPHRSRLYSLQPSRKDPLPRASVAIVLRLCPGMDKSLLSRSVNASQSSLSPSASGQSGSTTVDLGHPPPMFSLQLEGQGQGQGEYPQLERLFQQSWARSAQLEVLYVKRAHRKGDRWSGQLAFPGGRRQASDDSDRMTAERETCEEIGLDLAEEQRLGNVSFVGQLDDRVLTQWFSTKEMLVVSTFVYLDLRSDPLQLRLDPKEISAAFLVPFALFLEHMQQPNLLLRNAIPRPLLAHLPPILEHGLSFVGWLLRRAIGSLHFPCMDLFPELKCPNWMMPYDRKEEWQLWGLTLGITSDLLDLCFDTSQRQWKGQRIQSLRCTGVRLDAQHADINWILRWWASRRCSTIGKRSQDPDLLQRWDQGIRTVGSFSVLCKIAVLVWLWKRWNHRRRSRL